jgi:hypothetical protein
MTKMSGITAACALAFVLAASLASAQTPVRVRGVIEKVDGKTLSVKARDGAMVQVKLADDAHVLTLDKKSMADVKQGTFVGITAMPQPDGTQKAVEIHIFPEAMRGTGEGHYAWDLMPNSTMTNGNIDNQVVSNDGQTLVMKYKDGEKTITVPPNAEVVMFAPATPDDIKAGQKVFVPRGKKLEDGTVEAGVITIGSKGVDPPM